MKALIQEASTAEAKITQGQTWIWRAVLLYKGLLSIIVLGSFLAAFNSNQFRSAYAQWPQVGNPELSSRLATWDSAHYLLLSRAGYESSSLTCAFYPLWPGLIHVASFLTFD